MEARRGNHCARSFAGLGKSLDAPSVSVQTQTMRFVGTVDRVREPSGSAFEAYVSTGTPVILQGVVEDWPALRRWSSSYLAELLGDAPVRCKVSTSNAHPDFRCGDWRRAFATETLPFRSFIQRVSSGSPPERTRWLFTGDEQYVWRVRNGEEQHHEALQPLTRDFSLPGLVPRERLYSVWAWFSAAGVRTWLHYDNNGCHNLNVQVRGRKRAWLIAPEELDRCEMFPPGGDNPAVNCSSIDVDAPPQSSRWASMSAWEAEVREGEVLFIPVNWLHTFEHLGAFNANVNFWWKPDVVPDDPVARREASLRGPSPIP